MADDDNVVRPVFGKRKPTEAPQEKVAAVVTPARAKMPRNADKEEEEIQRLMEEMGPEGIKIAMIDIMYITTNEDFVHGVRNKLERLGALTGDKFIPNPDTLKTHRRDLRGSSFEQICELIDKTDETVWRKHPTYLAAVTLEYHGRFMYAISVLPEK